MSNNEDSKPPKKLQLRKLSRDESAGKIRVSKPAIVHNATETEIEEYKTKVEKAQTKCEALKRDVEEKKGEFRKLLSSNMVLLERTREIKASIKRRLIYTSIITAGLSLMAGGAIGAGIANYFSKPDFSIGERAKLEGKLFEKTEKVESLNIKIESMEDFNEGLIGGMREKHTDLVRKNLRLKEENEGYQSLIQDLKSENLIFETMKKEYAQKLDKLQTESNLTDSEISNAHNRLNEATRVNAQMKDKLKTLETLVSNKEDSLSEVKNQAELAYKHIEMLQGEVLEYKLMVSEGDQILSKIQAQLDASEEEEKKIKIPQKELETELKEEDKKLGDLELYALELEHDSPSTMSGAKDKLNRDGRHATFSGIRFLTHFPYCWKVAFTGENADGGEVGFFGRLGYALWSIPGLVPRAYEATAAHILPVKDGINAAITPIPGSKVVRWPLTEVASPVTGENVFPWRTRRAIGGFLSPETESLETDESQSNTNQNKLYKEFRIQLPNGKVYSYKSGTPPISPELRESLDKLLVRRRLALEQKREDYSPQSNRDHPSEDTAELDGVLEYKQERTIYDDLFDQNDKLDSYMEKPLGFDKEPKAPYLKWLKEDLENEK